MDQKIERIHKLLDELTEAVRDAFSDFTTIVSSCDIDGYRNFTVSKWGQGEDAETTPRRELFCQSKVMGEWTKDRSQKQNEYYEKCGLLLK